MALKKVITDHKGISTSYHKITDISVRGKENEFYSAHAALKSYVSEDIRQESVNNEVEISFYYFNLTEEEMNGNIFVTMYNKIKALEKFEGAEDC